MRNQRNPISNNNNQISFFTGLVNITNVDNTSFGEVKGKQVFSIITGGSINLYLSLGQFNNSFKNYQCTAPSLFSKDMSKEQVYRYIYAHILTPPCYIDLGTCNVLLGNCEEQRGGVCQNGIISRI
jgi:hypothetical protein